MENNTKVIVLHNAVNEHSSADEADVMHQVALVSEALENLGYMPESFAMGDDLRNDLEKIATSHPRFVFNLVESVFGKGELLYMAPALLNASKIPYTGVPAEGLYLTTNKVLAKKIMVMHGIPTPAFFSLPEADKLIKGKRYLLKPTCEDGSVGLDEDAVFTADQNEMMVKIRQLSASHYFIEEFIEGREFNLSVLGGNIRADVLPPAEMIFRDYPDGKPRMLGYKAKWDETSAEYRNTTRSFGTLLPDTPLYGEMVQLAVKCWDCFGLKGFARVDFRVDENSKPYVIEINGNPCISPDSGFIAAAHAAGLTNREVIGRIIEEIS